MTTHNTTRAKRWARLRHRVYNILESSQPNDRTALLVHVGLVGLVLLSVTATIFQSVPEIEEAYFGFFIAVERLTIGVFTVEFALRLWTAVDYPPLQHMPRWRARLEFMRSGGAIVDVLTIAPFYLEAIFPDFDLRVLVMLRLLRFMKLARYSPGIRSLYEAIYDERRALAACVVIVLGVVIASASVMHMVERNVQPDKFGTIPDAMWWAIITLTTVGYGDVVPISPLGKVVAAVTALLGIVMIALPVGIIATSFADVIHRREFVVTWGMLARVPFFASLNAEEVSEIQRLLRSQAAERGSIIVRRGEVGHSMYFIASGQVEIELPGGERHILGEGQFFGEIAVLKNTKRNATVRATVRTQLLVLDAADLRALMVKRPDIEASIRAVAQEREARRETVKNPVPTHDDDEDGH